MAKAQSNQNTALSPVKGLNPPRMRPALRKAIDEIVWKGRTQRAAADLVGMNETSLGRALARPPIAAWIETLKAQAVMDADKLKGQAKAMAVQAGIDLMFNATSEAVRARMVELFAGEGKGGGVNVVVNQAPSGYQYRRPLDQASSAIDGQAVDITPQSGDVGQ